jgi:integrase
MSKGIFKLPNGRYRWHIMLDGTRHNGIANSSKEATQARAEIITQHSKGFSIAPNQITFAEHLESWLLEKDRSRAIRTALGYRYTAGKYVSDNFKKKKLREIRPLHIKQMYSELQANVADSNTLRLTHVLIHGVLESALKEELIARNPAHGLKPKTTSKDDVKDLQVFTPEDAKRFAQACGEHKWGGIFLFMLLTGVRRGEACGLTWANVQLEGKNPFVKIEQALHCAGKQKLLTRPKTKSSRRVIYLSRDVVDLLKKIKLAQLALRQRLLERADHNDFVFTNSLGGMIGPDNLKFHMNAICKLACVPRIRIHDLRHTYASLALRAGTRIEVVSKQLGHASVMMTLDVYRHVYTEELENTAIPMARLFSAA